MFRLALKLIGALVAVLIVVYAVRVLFTTPSLTRDWSPDQMVLATSTIEGNLVTITNIRNIAYQSSTTYEVAYYDKTFDLRELESAWYMVEPFAGYGFGAAHTLVSFGFSDGSYVSISAEIRKEKGELFSALKGAFRSYELVYMIADERDVLGLRAAHRKHDVYLYPVVASKESIREAFVSMLKRANTLATTPEYYHTITNNCTTNLVLHINDLIPGKVPWSPRLFMPAYSDEYAYELGLLDNSVSLGELRARHYVSDKIRQYIDDPNFSTKIRQ